VSLHAPVAYRLPDQTARVARAAFPRGNPYLRMYDVLGPLFTNPEFADLYPNEGQPAEAPARLALVTIFQFAEGLSDRQAADAVRGRIDWKYALCLPLEDDGFDASVLSEFRARLLAGGAERRLFDALLERLKAHQLLKPRGRQRTDSTHVLAAIQVLSRLECVGETLRHALDTLARVAPAWLRGWVPAAWFDRYGRRFQDYRLPPGRAERTALAEQIGADGRLVLAAVDAPTAPAWLREVPAVQTLRRCWLQQFYAGEPVRWRTAADLPPAPLLLSSPYDPEARYSRKRTTEWTGYKVHLTETCDDDRPHLITDVATTTAPVPDYAATGAIQDRLAERGMLPSEHVVDAGYVTAAHLIRSRADHACELLGPAAEERSWQARAGQGYAAAQFAIDWEAERATCPQGKPSTAWKLTDDADGHPIVIIRFGLADCRACPVRALCVASGRERALRIRRREEHDALRTARQRQATPAFKERYATRAGIEGTISQGVHRCDLRRSRYVGLAKTALNHTLIAAALNFQRAAAWLADVPRSRTRQSAFAALPGTTT
jgi:transposase